MTSGPIHRAAAQSLFVGEAPELAVSNVRVPPKRHRWLPPTRDVNGGWTVKNTDGRTRHFETKDQADAFFEREVFEK